jgi:hypothetical protein
VARTAGMAFVAYCLVGGLAVGGIGGAAAVFVKARPDPATATKAKTVLELQVESARQIRTALARPVPQPEPLMPISSKINKPESRVVELASQPAQKQKPRLLPRRVRHAREAFASIETYQQPRPFSQLFAFGPDGH